MAMSLPRTERISRSDIAERSRPLKRIWPPVILPGGATSLMIDIAVTLLPQPDSPTSATASPRRTLNETLSTACTAPSAVKKEVRRFFTSRIASRGSTSRSATAAPGSPTGCAVVTRGIVARKVSGAASPAREPPERGPRLRHSHGHGRREVDDAENAADEDAVADVRKEAREGEG